MVGEIFESPRHLPRRRLRIERIVAGADGASKGDDLSVLAHRKTEGVRARAGGARGEC